MSAQPSPEAVALVAAACRTNGVLAIAVWQGIDVTVEQANADAAEEALFQYIQRLERDATRYATLRRLLFEDMALVEDVLVYGPDNLDRALTNAWQPVDAIRDEVAA